MCVCGIQLLIVVRVSDMMEKLNEGDISVAKNAFFSRYKRGICSALYICECITKCADSFRRNENAQRSSR